MRFLASTIAVVALTATIGSASAATLSYTNYSELNPVSVTVTDPSLNVNVSGLAGQVNLTTSTGSILSTFCFDIKDTLTKSGTFTTGSFVVGALGNSINALLSNVLPLLSSDTNASAALQVAIWQTEYSNVTVTSSNSKMMSEAASFVQNVASGLWKADATKAVAFLNGNGATQDQIYLTAAAVPTAVPEPATFGVLGMALAGFLATRRKSARPVAVS